MLELYYRQRKRRSRLRYGSTSRSLFFFHVFETHRLKASKQLLLDVIEPQELNGHGPQALRVVLDEVGHGERLFYGILGQNNFY